MSILGKQPSPYKNPTVHEDTTEIIRRLSEVLYSISPRKETVVAGVMIELAPLQPKFQEMYSSLYNVRDKLEDSDSAQIENLERVERKLHRLAEAAGEVLAQREEQAVA